MAPRLAALPSPAAPAIQREWWRDAVVYQVYLRSFADSNGDGIGDIAGLRSRLLYLVWLAVDALSINPHYPYGGADGGYDTVDYRAVDPDYGDLDALMGDANQLGLKVIPGAVPNHTPVQHPSSPISTRGRADRLGCGGQ